MADYSTTISDIRGNTVTGSQDSSYNYTIRVNGTIEQDYINLASKVKLNVYLDCNKYGYVTLYSSKGSLAGGTEKSLTSGSISFTNISSHSYPLGTIEGTVTHSSSTGKATCAIKAQTGASATNKITSIDTTIDLPDIPVSSKIAAGSSSITISSSGSSTTISFTLTPVSNKYYDTVEITTANGTVLTRATPSPSTNASTYTVSYSAIAKGSKTSSKTTVTAKVTSYSNSARTVKVGDNTASTSVTITAKPVISSLSTSGSVTTILPYMSSVTLTKSVTLADESPVTVTYTSSNSNATIDNANSKVNFNMVSSDYTTTITATATDARGNSGTKTLSLTVKGFIAPSLVARAYRADSSGNALTTGSYCKLAITSITSNYTAQTLTTKVTIKYDGTALATDVVWDQASSTKTYNRSGSTSTSHNYTVQIKQYDASNNLWYDSTTTYTVEKTSFPISLYDDGTNTGVGIGAEAASNRLSLGYPIEGVLRSYGRGYSDNVASTSYFLLFTIKFTASASYPSQPIEFEYLRRGDISPTRVSIRFANSSAPPFTVAYMRGLYIGSSYSDSIPCYCAYDSAGLEFKVIVAKAETYDSVTLLNINYGSYNIGRGMSIVFPSVLTAYSSLESVGSYIQCYIGGSIAYAKYLRNSNVGDNETPIYLESGSPVASTCKPSVYSTTETRIGTYNGKPLYRIIKTGKVNSSTDSTGLHLNQFTISNVATVVNITGAVLSQYNQYWPVTMSYFRNTGNDVNYYAMVYYDIANSVLNLRTGTYFNSNSTYNLVMEYTKTTD